MIKTKNLTHYYNKDLAIENINLEINTGDFICFIGESGSGKSTLLSILSTLLKPTSGEIIYEDINYANINNIDKFRKENVGFIFQFHYLINYLTIKENIKLANENAKDEEIVKLLRKLGIEELKDKNPTEISGGQRQRASIARALINTPKVVFADEPTGNLDSENSQKVFEMFKELSNNGTTVIVATHDKNLAQTADIIYEVKDGKLK